jgi:hypothetical protein
LVEKDQTTGKCYMKIPVENGKTVENIFNLFGALVKGLQK